MVPPSELGTRESNWLQKSAVTLAAESDPGFRIRLRNPQFLLDQNTEEVSMKASVTGYDPIQNLNWKITRTIHLDTVLGKLLPAIPLGKKVDWDETSSDDIAQETIAAMKNTEEYELAKVITASFQGFIGTSADAKQGIETMLVRYAARKAHAVEVFVRIGSDRSIGDAEGVIPWKVRITSKRKLHIFVKQELQKQVSSRVRPVRLRTLAPHAVLEVLDAMLMELIKRSSLITIFEVGAQTADLFDVDEDELGLSTLEPCTEDDRTHHWHTCAGCLTGHPCTSFNDRSTYAMLCAQCVEQDKHIGWKLEQLLLNKPFEKVVGPRGSCIPRTPQ